MHRRLMPRQINRSPLPKSGHRLTLIVVFARTKKRLCFDEKQGWGGTVRVPWKIRNASRLTGNYLAFVQNKMLGLFKAEMAGKHIVFACDFHGITGATIAIARIANLLANKYRVSFAADPFSDYNVMLEKKVVIIPFKSLKKNKFDLYVCDGHMGLSFFSWLAERNRKSLLTIHGVLRKENRLEKVHLASKSHLVGETQFMNHEVDQSRYFVIPNYCEKIIKKRHANNVGIVGRLDDPNKNVPEALSIAKLSDAKEIHLWGGTDSRLPEGRVKYHAWTRNKNRIYDSFDVLISMSKEESMGLTVIEAMSCGIPCVLADIPGFQVYKNCPGVALVQMGDWEAAIGHVNRFLKKKAELKTGLVNHWDGHYSRHAVAEMWFREIEKLTS
ncbi:MAG TPA: glycosyltransferase [Thiobacillus sp.]|nr:glycosyltransferase [Thiobacillus sp.]